MLLLRNPYFMLVNWIWILPTRFEETDSIEEADVWLRHLVNKSYSQIVPPTALDLNNVSEPTIVTCFLKPKSVTAISIKTMDFDVDLDINLVWHDFRLNILIDDKWEVVLPPDVALKLWYPRIKFRNCKGCDDFVVDRKIHSISLSPFYRQLSVGYRKIFKFICNFNLKAFPFDVQTCNIILEALLPVRFIRLIIDRSFEEQLVKQLSVPPEFTLISYKADYLECQTIHNNQSHVKDCLNLSFTFYRGISHYVTMFYTPSMFIVALSWISFWFEAEATAPRVALGLTTMLTLTTQFNSMASTLPHVSYVKAIDVWMFACIFSVFCSLVEFAIINQLVKHKKTSKIHPASAINGRIFCSNKIVSARTAQMLPWYKCNEKVDAISRMAFPLVFGIFNITYWSYYAF